MMIKQYSNTCCDDSGEFGDEVHDPLFSMYTCVNNYLKKTSPGIIGTKPTFVL